jgi:ATP-binding cassette subfamily B protein
LLAYARRAPYAYSAGALLTVAYAVSAPWIPIATGQVVDALRAAGEGEVARRVVWLIELGVGVSVVRLLSRIVMFRAARDIEYEIRNDFLAHLQRLPASYFAANRTGDLMSRAVNDLNSLRLFLGMGLMNLIQTPVLYVSAFAGMFAIDALLTAAVVAPYVLFIWIVRQFGRHMMPASIAVQEQVGALASVAQENAAGVFVVRTYATEPRERERFAGQNEELYRRKLRFGWIQLAMQPTIAVMPALASVVLLFLGGLRVQRGELTFGEFMAFHTYLVVLTVPTVMLGFTVAMAQRGLAGLRRLVEVLDVVPAIREREGALAPARIEGAVEIRDLAFGYGGGRAPALCGVSVRAEPGSTIGVVGSVGSGKSTLVQAIPRLIEFEDGHVLVDGIDVNHLELRVLRSSIAMVPQDSFLFSATVAENIALGRPDASLEEIRAAAARAHVLHDIEELPYGMDTPVGERGITLSGGQRQRIALARALLLDPAILILDDSLSSVDAVTEEAILKNLRGARAGRTCFIVAHRLSAVRDATQIVVLEGGRVVENGTHEDLLRANGAYAQTFRRQQLEDQLRAEGAA